MRADAHQFQIFCSSLTKRLSLGCLAALAACGGDRRAQTDPEPPPPPSFNLSAATVFHNGADLFVIEDGETGRMRSLLIGDERYPSISSLALAPRGDFLLAFQVGRLAGSGCSPGDGRALRVDLARGDISEFEPAFFEFRYSFDSYISADGRRLWISADGEVGACPPGSELYSLDLSGNEPPAPFTQRTNFVERQIIGRNRSLLSAADGFIAFTREEFDLHFVRTGIAESETAVDLESNNGRIQILQLNAFSPDERYLVYQVFTGPGRQQRLRLANTDSGRFREVSSLPAEDVGDAFASATNQAFSAVDNRFVYVELFTDESGTRLAPRLILENADDSNDRVMLNETLADDTSKGTIQRPMRSADGRWVVYEADLAGKGEGIWRVSPDAPGQSVRLSAPGQTELKLIAISSLADHVVYEIKDSGVWINRLSQPGEPRQIAELEMNRGIFLRNNIKFSADGRKMLFVIDLREDVGAFPENFPPNKLLSYTFGSSAPAQVLYDSPDDLLNVRQFFILPRTQ